MRKFLKALRVAGDVAEIIVATQLFRQFEPKKEENLTLLENLSRTTITEQQFCQIIGRLRLYQALPTEQQRELPEVILEDQAINAATRSYTSNPNFGKREGEDITCWNLMQLLNEAVKANYFYFIQHLWAMLL